MYIARIQVKKGQRTDLSQTKKKKEIVKNVFQNKMEQIKKNANQLQKILVQVKEGKYYLKKNWIK